MDNNLKNEQIDPAKKSATSEVEWAALFLSSFFDVKKDAPEFFTSFGDACKAFKLFCSEQNLNLMDDEAVLSALRNMGFAEGEKEVFLSLDLDRPQTFAGTELKEGFFGLRLKAWKRIAIDPRFIVKD